jgi:hypothetical protein
MTSPPFIESDALLLCSQGPVTGRHPEQYPRKLGRNLLTSFYIYKSNVCKMKTEEMQFRVTKATNCQESTRCMNVRNVVVINEQSLVSVYRV